MKLERVDLRKFEKDRISKLNSIKGGKRTPTEGGSNGYTADGRELRYGSDTRVSHWWTKRQKMILHDLSVE